MGASALCWATIWLNRNETVFKGTIPNLFWSLLSKEEEKTILNESCRKLEVTVMVIFNKFGWNFRSRLQA